MKTLLGLFLGTLLAVPCFAAAVGQEVLYNDGETVMKGYLAYDDATGGKRPGVLVVHEWWGHNEYARMRARMLAELGYTALAVDMYGDGRLADHPETAGQFSGELRQNMPVAESRFKAAMQFLQQHPTVDAGRIAAIGYCFGGGIVLEMARRGLDLQAVASFHGSLGTDQPAKAGQVRAKVLIANGADDPFTKPEQITAIRQEFDAAGVDYQFINYPGARHSFTNPGADALGQRFNLPLAYNKEADEQSWEAMRKLFAGVFQLH